MSLYEVFSNKPAVILDIGYAYTKCGFAGDASPFAILPTQIDRYDSSAAKTQTYRIHDAINNQALLEELLTEFLYKIYYKILNANSKERKVVIVESMLCNSEFRKTLADVLFQIYHAQSITFLNSHLAPLYTLGVNKALLLDCGYTDCQIMPIAEQTLLIGLCEFANLGGRAIHKRIESLIRSHAKLTLKGQTMPVSDISQEDLHLSEEILEDIKLRCCFVSPLERIKKYYEEIETKKLPLDSFTDLDFKFAPDCKYTLPNNVILNVPGFIREFALDFLFRDLIDSFQTLPNLILDTILKSPIDYRKDFMDNIVLTGGTCMLFGFKSRLVDELKHLVLNDEKYAKHFFHKEFKFLVPPAHDNCVAWLGGAIFGSLDSLDLYGIQNSKYKQIEKLPDWFTLYEKKDCAKKV